MRNVNRMWTAPVSYPKSRRNHPIGVLSSGQAGKVIPICAIPMFREDSLAAMVRVTTEMLETKELLMNPVRCRITAWLSPFLADPRFSGDRAELDRSYMGQASLTTGEVVPFVENAAMPDITTHPIFKTMGMHAKTGDQVNVGYVTHYNLIHNHRLMQRSMKLHEIAERELDDTSLAPAFWQHGVFQHAVPDFDEAVIDGQIALDVVSGYADVVGLAYRDGEAPPGNVNRTTDDAVINLADYDAAYVNTVSGGPPHVYADMQTTDIRVSLANIELAKKLQGFAMLRKRYEGHDDDYIIDMLMQGLSIPDKNLTQPINLFDRTVTFSQAKRYATDSGNLDDSAVSGVASMDVRVRCPRINTGGIVFVMMEILPDQLWERQADWYLHSRPKAGRPAHDYWPDAERDFLDTQKVDVIYNGEVDTAHTDPTGYWAFGPMNAKYNQAGYRVGGKFLRPSVDTSFDESRQRLYAVEGTDPVFTEDFMIASAGIHNKPFLDDDPAAEPFEFTAVGNAVMHGLTQFGGKLIEATGNYDAEWAKVPTDKVDPALTEDPA